MLRFDDVKKTLSIAGSASGANACVASETLPMKGRNTELRLDDHRGAERNQLREERDDVVWDSEAAVGS